MRRTIAQVTLKVLDSTNRDASGLLYDPEDFPPEHGEFVAMIGFEGEPELESEFRCNSFADAETAVRASMPLRSIDFVRCVA